MKLGDVSIKARLIILFLVLSLVPMLVIGILAYDNASAALKEKAFDQLTSVREAKGRQIEAYFGQIENQIITFSKDKMIVDFATREKAAFWDVDTVSDEKYAEMEASVKDYYENEFLTRLNNNLEEPKSVTDYFPEDRETIILQYCYISNNDNPTGEKCNLNDAEDGSEYSRLHSVYHPIIKNYLERFGYYDIFLADPDTGHIFYTVFKEVDYTTSLLTGPYSNTKFAKAFREAVEAGKNGDQDFVAIEDFEPYDPSYHAPASFIASPVFSDDGEFVAVLMFQMPVDEINKVMTGDQGWVADGLGTTGETYLVGSDYMMRSISRFFIEDRENMLNSLRELGYSEAAISEMEKVDTTIGLVKVQTEASESAFAGDADTKIIADYRGVPVLSSFRKLNIEGLDYVLLSELDDAEAFEAAEALEKKMIIIGIVAIILVGLIAYFVAMSISRPINNLSDKFDEITLNGNFDTRVEVNSKNELGRLAESFNMMAEWLSATMKRLNEGTGKGGAGAKGGTGKV